MIGPILPHSPSVSTVKPQASIAQGVQFAGLHQDSVISIPTTLDNPLNNRAFNRMVRDFERTPFAHRELYLKRDPKNGTEIVVSLDRSARQRVGTLTGRVAEAVAPLMDEGDTRFQAVLTGVDATGEQPVPQLRVELLTNPGRSPNVTRTQMLRYALDEVGVEYHTEKIDKARIGGDTLVRVVNAEQSLENWYLNSHLLQRVDLKRDSVQPAFHARKKPLPTYVSEMMMRDSLSSVLKHYKQAASQPATEQARPARNYTLPAMKPLLDEDSHF